MKKKIIKTLLVPTFSLIIGIGSGLLYTNIMEKDSNVEATETRGNVEHVDFNTAKKSVSYGQKMKKLDNIPFDNKEYISVKSNKNNNNKKDVSINSSSANESELSNSEVVNTSYYGKNGEEIQLVIFNTPVVPIPPTEEEGLIDEFTVYMDDLTFNVLETEDFVVAIWEEDGLSYYLTMNNEAFSFYGNKGKNIEKTLKKIYKSLI